MAIEVHLDGHDPIEDSFNWAEQAAAGEVELIYPGDDRWVGPEEQALMEDEFNRDREEEDFLFNGH